MSQTDLSIDTDKYAQTTGVMNPWATPPSAKLQKRFVAPLKESVHRELYAIKEKAHAEGWSDEAGYIRNSEKWKDVPKELRLSSVGMIMADVAAGKDLRRAHYPKPNILAALTIDTTEMVELFQQTIMELAAPMRLGSLLLRRESFTGGVGSTTARVASAVAEDYIMERKKSGAPYREVASDWEYATCEMQQHGLTVRMDRWDLAKLPWDEFARQLNLLSMGAARTENMIVYNAFFTAYGSGTRPFPSLENVGGTAASALTTIDSSDTTPYKDNSGSNIARTDGDIIYYDYLYARQKLQSRPNALDMVYIVVAPVQWERMEYWNVSQKIAFARVLGRNGQAFTPMTGFDGRIVPVTVIVDDDIADSEFLVNSKNIALYCGPPDYVGRLIVDEEPTIFSEWTPSHNTDDVHARMSMNAVVSSYNSWAFQYNLLTTYT